MKLEKELQKINYIKQFNLEIIKKRLKCGKNGASERIRTVDNHVGNVRLYH